MTINLTSSQEMLIRQKVDTGLYRDANEVVDEALQLLDERDRLNRLKAAIDVGDEQIRRGQVVRWTPELLQQLIQQSEEKARQGIMPNPDVCP
jgi:antitoxin ParD1/3/4